MNTRKKSIKPSATKIMSTVLTSKDCSDISQNLDPEEQELHDSIERGEWNTTDNLKEEIETARIAAENYFKKDIMVSLRMSKETQKRLKHIAVEAGMPYQRLISNVLNRYSLGLLKDFKRKTG